MKLGSNDIGSVYIGSTAVNKIYIGSTEVWTSNSGLLADYPGAAAAYSLRLLQTTYTGNAIRVRRASDNAETNIGFVDGQLDTTTLETFCSGTNGYVTTWYDQSGNGNDATQTTAASQPQIVSSGSVILEGGKPSVQFDGTDDYLFNLDNYSIINDVTSVLVYKSNTNTNSEDSVLYQYNQDNNNHISHGFRNGGLFFREYKNSTTNELNGYDFSSTSQFLSFNLYDYSLSTNSLYVNNVIGADNNSGRSQANSISQLTIGARVGGAYAVDGELQELILYPSDQSSNRTGIETNINNFYNIY